MTTRRIVCQCWILTTALLLALETGAHAGFIPLTATLSGTQETPPNASPGIGAASFILDDTNGILVSSVTFANLTSPTLLDGFNTSAHIHTSVLPAPRGQSSIPSPPPRSGSRPVRLRTSGRG